MMKKVYYVIVAMVVTSIASSCGESAKERAQRERIDSLENVAMQGQLDYKDLQGYLAIIAEGLDSISMEEHELLGKGVIEEGSQYNKQGMRQRLMHVRDLLARHRERIDNLELQLKDSKGDAQRLHTIVLALQQQLAQKEKEIEQLRADLDDSRKSVADLRKRVSGMRDIQETQKTIIENQQTTIQNQNDKIHSAYVRIASKKVLKDEGLLTGGFLRKKKIDYSNIDLSLFEQIDTRKTTVLAVPAKAKVLTPVPKNSYTLKDGTLTIVDSNAFWSVSKFLIIQSD